MVDALGNPLGFTLSGGQAHDLVGADRLLPTIAAGTVIADKAFDADRRGTEPWDWVPAFAGMSGRGRLRW